MVSLGFAARCEAWLCPAAQATKRFYSRRSRGVRLRDSYGGAQPRLTSGGEADSTFAIGSQELVNF